MGLKQLEYSLDTSVLVGAWVRIYPPDGFPTLWDRLYDLAAADNAKIAELVYFELETKDDDLFEWCKNRKEELIYPLDEDLQIQAKEVLAEFGGMIDVNRPRGGSDADPFVVALARMTGAKVVTEEKYHPNRQKLNLPSVCNQLGIEFINMKDLILEQNWRF